MATGSGSHLDFPVYGSGLLRSAVLGPVVQSPISFNPGLIGFIKSRLLVLIGPLNNRAQVNKSTGIR